MFNKKNLKRYAIFSLVLNIVIALYIMSVAAHILSGFIMALMYLCVGINEWRFRYPTTLMGPAINGWLMTIAAVLGFVFVNSAEPSLTVWSWISLANAAISIPGMLHPNQPFDPGNFI